MVAPGKSSRKSTTECTNVQIIASALGTMMVGENNFYQLENFSLLSIITWYKQPTLKDAHCFDFALFECGGSF